MHAIVARDLPIEIVNTANRLTLRCFRPPAPSPPGRRRYGARVSAFEDLPDRRSSLIGLTDEQDEVWLIRSISRKLYRCPGCHGEIGIGSEHVVVHYVRRGGGGEHHHWHRHCADERLVPSLRNLRAVDASESERGRVEGRARQRPGRRRKPR